MPKKVGLIVTIFKSELEKYPELSPTLQKISKEVNSMEEACIYAPQPGYVVEFINLLQRYQVGYGLHSGGVSKPQSSGEDPTDSKYQ